MSIIDQCIVLSLSLQLLTALISLSVSKNLSFLNAEPILELALRLRAGKGGAR